MSSFKDLIASDLGVFLNADEFAEEHEVEGNTIIAVLDEDIQDESKNGEALGLAEADTLLYAKSADLPDRRPSGESLNVDGREYTVITWREDAGMASVYLAHQIAG